MSNSSSYPVLKQGDIIDTIIMDNLGSHKSTAVAG